ncbi:MAG: hypothetical protein PHP44_09525 [Kiritimatiellae bacterium]|nr:hypothetical protein [Kiritimatiellia bacterium]
MNIRQVRDLALKIFGIYYLSNALVRAPQFASLFFSWNRNPEMAGHGFAIALSVLSPIAFWLIIGLLLTFRTPRVAGILWKSQEEPASSPTARPSLSFWIVLVGFFFFVSAAGGAVAEAWILAFNRQMRGSFVYYKFFPEVVTLVLSIVCILKAQAIEAWLSRKIGESSRLEVEPISPEVAPSASPDEPST